MITKNINDSYEIKQTRFEQIKDIISSKLAFFFEFVFATTLAITVVVVGISCFILFSYKGIKYLYTFTENEILEYHQKKEDLIVKKIEIEARLALRTYKEEGLTGLVGLSKSRYEFLQKNEYSVEDLYRIATIDIVGEKLDEVFLDRLSAIAEERSDQESLGSITATLKSEYFGKALTNNRIADIRKLISDQKTPDTEVMRFYIDKVLLRVISEQLGNNNQLTNTTAKNIIKTTLDFSYDFMESFGLVGLQRFSQLCYREMEQSDVISLQQLEKCFAVDVYGLTYFTFNKIPRTTATEYFAVESVKNRPSALFNKLGISEDEAYKYRQAWFDEIMVQGKKFFKKEDE